MRGIDGLSASYLTTRLFASQPGFAEFKAKIDANRTSVAPGKTGPTGAVRRLVC
jgi:hypothetical protein